MKFTEEELKKIQRMVDYPYGQCSKCGAALQEVMGPKRTLVKRIGQTPPPCLFVTPCAQMGVPLIRSPNDP